MTVVIPTVTKDTLNTALASTDVVIEVEVVQEAPTTAVSVSVTTTGDAVAPVLADLSAAVKAQVAADTGINAEDLVVVEAEVVAEATTAAPVAAAPVAATPAPAEVVDDVADEVVDAGAASIRPPHIYWSLFIIGVGGLRP